MTKKDAIRYVSYWKKKLGLSEWQIEVITHRLKKKDIPNAGRALATASIIWELKHVIVDVWFPCVDRRGRPEDLEAAMVHELIHVFFHPFWPKNGEEGVGKHRSMLIEEAVERIAKCVLEADRRLQAANKRVS
jgi:hypothetical protein